MKKSERAEMMEELNELLNDFFLTKSRVIEELEEVSDSIKDIVILLSKQKR